MVDKKDKQNDSCKIILPGDRIFSLKMGSIKWILSVGTILILLAVSAAAYLGYHLYAMQSERAEFSEYKQYKKEKREALEKMLQDHDRILRDITELNNIEKRLESELQVSTLNQRSSFWKLSIDFFNSNNIGLEDVSSKKLKDLLKLQNESIYQMISERKRIAAELLSKAETSINKESFPDLWPVKNGSITSVYGGRISPFSQDNQWHPGIDIADRYGSAVFASGAGVVIIAGVNGSYGKYVCIDHENGYKSSYGHLSSLAVQSGDRVYKGQVVGYIGTTGYSTGPHLHYEVFLKDENIDPYYVLQK